jgi:hypothetical protein
MFEMRKEEGMITRSREGAEFSYFLRSQFAAWTLRLPRAFGAQAKQGRIRDCLPFFASSRLRVPKLLFARVIHR